MLLLVGLAVLLSLHLWRNSESPIRETVRAEAVKETQDQDSSEKPLEKKSVVESTKEEDLITVTERTNPEEKGLRSLEGQRFEEAVHWATRLNATVRGFYHTSAWQRHWREVISEQLHLVSTESRSTSLTW